MKFEPVLNGVQLTRCRIFADGISHMLMYPMKEHSNVSNSQLLAVSLLVFCIVQRVIFQFEQQCATADMY